MLMELRTGKFVDMTLEMIKRMTRAELISHLELRGMACYADESTSLLRETAIEDWEGEITNGG